MEEMHRMHKEPVWGWVGVVADLIAAARRPRAVRVAECKPLPKPAPYQTATS